MQLSSRLQAFYDRSCKPCDTNDTTLAGLLQLAPLGLNDIPHNLNDKLKFSHNHFVSISACMTAFTRIAQDLSMVQQDIDKLTRYSSFLNPSIAFRANRVPQSVLQKRDKLNRLRNLFTESLLNDDMATAHIVGGVNNIFSELDNFREFLQGFGEYVSSANLSIRLEDNCAVNYMSRVKDMGPGSIMSMCIGAKPDRLLDKQITLIDSIRNHRSCYNDITTDSNTLCWSLFRSYIDLPMRLLERAGFNPIKETLSLQYRVEAISTMHTDRRCKPGIIILADWTAIIYNAMLMLVSLVDLYGRIMLATYDCLWEFFFYQLHVLEEEGDTEILESVLAMCQSTLFKVG